MSPEDHKISAREDTYLARHVAEDVASHTELQPKEDDDSLRHLAAAANIIFLEPSSKEALRLAPPPRPEDRVDSYHSNNVPRPTSDDPWSDPRYNFDSKGTHRAV